MQDIDPLIRRRLVFTVLLKDTTACYKMTGNKPTILQWSDTAQLYRPRLLTRVRQGVEVSAEHQWNGIGLTGDRGQLEAACGLVHYVLHL